MVPEGCGGGLTTKGLQEGIGEVMDCFFFFYYYLFILAALGLSRGTSYLRCGVRDPFF